MAGKQETVAYRAEDWDTLPARIVFEDRTEERTVRRFASVPKIESDIDEVFRLTRSYQDPHNRAGEILELPETGAEPDERESVGMYWQVTRVVGSYAVGEWEINSDVTLAFCEDDEYVHLYWVFYNTPEEDANVDLEVKILPDIWRGQVWSAKGLKKIGRGVRSETYPEKPVTQDDTAALNEYVEVTV